MYPGNEHGVLHSMEDEIHRSNPKHACIEVKTEEHFFLDMILMFLKQVSRIDFVFLTSFLVGHFIDRFWRTVFFVEVFDGFYKETTRSAGRITNHIGWFRFHHSNHVRNDMSWCAKLAVDTCGGEFL